MAKERDFYGIKIDDHQKLTFEEYQAARAKQAAHSTLRLPGKKGPTDRILSEFRAYEKHSREIRKRAGKQLSDVRVHRYIFDNAIIFEFLNQKNITLEWIRNAHERCGHSPVFPLNERITYLWKKDLSESAANEIGLERIAKFDTLESREKEVIGHFNKMKKSIAEIFLDFKLNEKRVPTVPADLGELTFISTDFSIKPKWSKPPQNFGQAILRDFFYFYHQHPYCLDMLKVCGFCGRFFVSKSEIKTFCSPACRDGFNNKKKLKKRKNKR